MNWDSIKEKLEPFRRKTWVPETKPMAGSSDCSKFSGNPVLPVNESWPCCKNCDQPMQLFLQLDSNSLPVEAGKPFGEGFLQVFYCTNWEQECEVDCEAFFPFSKSTLVRVLPFGACEASQSNPVKDKFPEVVISGWKEKTDYPNWEELESLNFPLTDEESDCLCDQDTPLSGDKLLGWPHWVQGVEYPDCPECGQKMELVFQIDSEDNLPYMFGDAGCSHVTQCKRHPHLLTIAWACG